MRLLKRDEFFVVSRQQRIINEALMTCYDVGVINKVRLRKLRRYIDAQLEARMNNESE